MENNDDKRMEESQASEVPTASITMPQFPENLSSTPAIPLFPEALPITEIARDTGKSAGEVAGISALSNVRSLREATDFLLNLTPPEGEKITDDSELGRLLNELKNHGIDECAHLSEEEKMQLHKVLDAIHLSWLNGPAISETSEFLELKRLSNNLMDAAEQMNTLGRIGYFHGHVDDLSIKMSIHYRYHQAHEIYKRMILKAEGPSDREAQIMSFMYGISLTDKVLKFRWGPLAKGGDRQMDEFAALLGEEAPPRGEMLSATSGIGGMEIRETSDGRLAVTLRKDAIGDSYNKKILQRHAPAIARHMVRIFGRAVRVNIE